MNVFFLLFLLGSIAVASLWIGKKSQGVKSQDGFFLMDRKLSFFSLIMTLLATQIGGGMLMGAAEEAYQRGWIVLFYPLGMVLGMLTLGLGFGAKMRRLNLTTVAELFEKKYRSINLRRIASLLSIISLMFILVAQAVAARKFFLSIGFTHNFLFIFFWIILVAYTVMGGFKAVVMTDVLQCCFILFAFIVTFFAIKLGAPPLSSSSSLVEGGHSPWVSWLLMPFFFTLIEQEMGQRCFASKSPWVFSLSACIGSFVLFIASLFPIYLGILASKIGLIIPEGASVLITSVEQLTNSTISTLLICAILVAVISTADSLLCSISSNLAYDFTADTISVRFCRLLTFVVGASALLFSFLFSNVLAVLIFSQVLIVSVLFVPVIMALFLTNLSKKAAIASMSLGGVTLLFSYNHPLPFLLPLLFSMGGFFLFSIRKKASVISD
ncbi:MAG: hypothetical protein S4CHLAM45_04100 [Chlamydiales bacterium]|nr:hypothetical protein [Chlamydiales bacterium]MCH9619264.1 hypothetical protein [Chlamydiales bacterium]MCH9622526.1 hypothetical protein [Chlamydiales bacterium]